MKAHIVVGSSFGDESKGLTTDWLCRTTTNNIVVRHNGGCQAGHTVETKSGLRHAFGHIGSGTFAGSPTYLSKYFIVNPRAFLEEQFELQNIDTTCIVICNGDAPLSTPYDVMINRHAEMLRSTKRHGSCGMGINETITRNDNPKYNLTVKDILHEESFRIKLLSIRDRYVKMRLSNLKITEPLPDICFEDDYIDEYINECKLFVNVVKIVFGDTFLTEYDNVIFEGAQGLLLDEHHHFFPHVTRSKTGVYNAVQILKGIYHESAEVYYITRTYLTRHGAGPLPFEGEIEPHIDNTNKTNTHQGSLRFAPLNIDLLQESISDDLNSVKFNLNHHLVVTWMNVLNNKNKLVTDDKLIEVDDETFIETLNNIENFDNVYHSYSPHSIILG